MKDQRKTKAQLIEELDQLRARVAELEGASHHCGADDHLYREMVEHANDVVYTLSPDGAFTYVSPNWTEVLGHQTDEVVGTDFTPFVHPDDLERCHAFLVRVFQTGERQGPIEYRVQHKDGRYRWHTSNAALLDAPDGSKVYVGIAHDVTERRQVEEALRDSEAMLSSVLDNSSTVIFIKDLEGKYLLINRCYEELFHISRQEIVGKTDFDIFPAEAAQKFQEKDRRALEHGPIEEEEQVPQDDGVHTYVSVKFPLHDTAGEPYATCGIATDITARKQAEVALQLAHEKLERRVEERTREIRDEKAFTDTALNALPGLFYVFDSEGRFRRWNSRFGEITGYSDAEIAERPATSYFEGEDLEKVQASIVETITHGEGEVEADMITRDGARLPHYFSGIHATIDGEPFIVGMAIDISERRRTEAALRSSEQMFRSLTESVNAMIYIVGLEQQELIYANPAAIAGMGYTMDELTADPPPELLAPASMKLVEEARDAYFRGEKLPASMELEFITKAGEHRWYETTAGLVQTERGLAKVTVSFDVTDRRHAEQALRDSERKFRALADGTLAGIAITQCDRFLYVNKAIMERSGLSWEALSQIDAHEMLSQPAWEAGGRAEQEAKARGDDQYTFEFLDPDGAWYEVTGCRIELDGREATIWTSFDITDRKNALVAMEGSERRFRGLAENSTAHITIIQDDTYVYANQAFLDYQGIDDLEELQLISPEDLMMGAMGPDVMAAAEPAYEAAISRGDNHFRFEYQDLEGIWFEAGVTIMELDGQPAYMATTFDITEHKQAQERYRTIFDTAGTGMISFGEDSVITLANEEWTKLSGFSIEETVGELTWQRFFTEESLAQMKKYHELRSKDPAAAPRAYEAHLVDRAGKVHDGIVNIQVVPGTQQRVASFQDLTELKRAQRQMFRADKMAALGQIIAGVAHEINNPNNFIYFNLPILRRYVEAMRPLLERTLEQEPERRILNMPYDVFLEDVFKLLENMEHGSQRITSIVSDLKTYIRSDEDTQMKVGRLEPVIDQVMTLIGKQVRKMVRRFETDVAEGLPDVRINPGKMEQVLINLAINAGQAADKDQSWIRLTARPAEDDGFVEILVEDNGAGIPPDQLEQVFEPFYTSKGREEGTGLGLSISHQIVQEHGGDILVSSEVGQGSCFTVRLPAAE